MRALIFIQRYQAGGAERHAAYLANYLYHRKNIEVYVLAFGGKGDISRAWFKIPSDKLINLGFKEKNILYGGFRPDLLVKKARDIQRLKKQLKLLKPDVIIPFTYEPNIIAGNLWKIIGAKKCIWNQQDEGRYFEGKKFEQKALQNCSHWVTNSEAGRQFLEKYGVSNIQLIHNGIEIPAEQKLQVDDGVFRAVMLANLHVFKDHMTLLNGWNIFVSKYPQKKFELILAGKDGNATQDIRSFIIENNLADTVTLAGQVSNIFELLKRCSIAVFSSSTEGLPNAVLECMAIGLPVIGSRIPGMVEALGEDCPYLFEPKNYVELANMLEDAYLKRNELKIIGIQNQKRIEQYFSLEKMGSKYLDLLTDTEITTT
ncbi:glycosyltransferase family 4 protein [Peijinzhouia sedimentorum]